MINCVVCFESISDNAVYFDPDFLNCSCYSHNHVHKQCFLSCKNINKCIICNSKYSKPLNLLIYNGSLIDEHTDQSFLAENVKNNGFLLKYIKE